jgi:transcriptional regulator with XRE-family HTH domain
MKGIDLQLAATIRAVRDEQALSREKFARKLDISAAMVASLEKGRRPLSIEIAIKLADVAKSAEKRLALLRTVGITRERIGAWFGESSAMPKKALDKVGRR